MRSQADIYCEKRLADLKIKPDTLRAFQRLAMAFFNAGVSASEFTKACQSISHIRYSPALPGLNPFGLVVGLLVLALLIQAIFLVTWWP